MPLIVTENWVLGGLTLSFRFSLKYAFSEAPSAVTEVSAGAFASTVNVMFDAEPWSALAS